MPSIPELHLPPNLHFTGQGVWKEGTGPLERDNVFHSRFTESFLKVASSLRGGRDVTRGVVTAPGLRGVSQGRWLRPSPLPAWPTLGDKWRPRLDPWPEGAGLGWDPGGGLVPAPFLLPAPPGTRFGPGPSLSVNYLLRLL